MNNESFYDLNKVVQQLDILGCNSVEIRIFSSFNLTKIKDILSYFDHTVIESIQLYIKFNNFKKNELLKLSENFPRISDIVVHSSPALKKAKHTKLNTSIVFTKEFIDDENHCGFIKPKYFRSNVKMFSESLNYNSCLNQKISIDSKGEIKNCPAMKKSFGNTDDITDFNKIIKTNEFQKKWNISKDQIETCKVCEFIPFRL